MLKPRNELRALDVSKFVKQREGKDDKGNKIFIPYLPWGRCIDLLYENGAEKVWFRPLMTADGSYIFASREVETRPRNNDLPRKTGCYFVRVEITVDGDTWEYDYPLMNGATVVYDDTLNQRAINTAHNRAFVKGVAFRTGLGWSLWADTEEQDEPTDDLQGHRIEAVQKRLEQRITYLMQTRTVEEIAAAIGWNRKLVDEVMTKYFRGIIALEEGLKKL